VDGAEVGDEVEGTPAVGAADIEGDGVADDAHATRLMLRTREISG
jgi:hypothetical protein